MKNLADLKIVSDIFLFFFRYDIMIIMVLDNEGCEGNVSTNDI